MVNLREEQRQVLLMMLPALPVISAGLSTFSRLHCNVKTTLCAALPLVYPAQLSISLILEALRCAGVTTGCVMIRGVSRGTGGGQKPPPGIAIAACALTGIG